MKSNGLYTFNIVNRNSNLKRKFEFDNYITAVYRYYNSNNYLYTFLPRSYSYTYRDITYTYYPTIYFFAVFTGSNFNNPLILEEPFHTLNISGKTLTENVDYKKLGLVSSSVESVIENTDGISRTFTSSSYLSGPFSFYACLATSRAATFVETFSALNFPEISVLEDEDLYVTYTILNRW